MSHSIIHLTNPSSLNAHGKRKKVGCTHVYKTRSIDLIPVSSDDRKKAAPSNAEASIVMRQHVNVIRLQAEVCRLGWLPCRAPLVAAMHAYFVPRNWV